VATLLKCKDNEYIHLHPHHPGVGNKSHTWITRQRNSLHVWGWLFGHY